MLRIVSLASLRTVVLAWVVSGFSVSTSAAQDSVETVLGRAGVYATQFRRQLSNLVAEETYVQDMRVPIGVISTAGTHGEPVRHRELKSDLLMIRPAERYVEFRDVFEVDGNPVRDRQNRLASLFLSDKANNAEQVEKIAQESALQHRECLPQLQHADAGAAVPRAGNARSLPFQASRCEEATVTGERLEARRTGWRC